MKAFLLYQVNGDPYAVTWVANYIEANTFHREDNALPERSGASLAESTFCCSHQWDMLNRILGDTMRKGQALETGHAWRRDLR